ncbi:hypothetical protein [Mitsuokella sp. WILCCON 0060]|uniref:hypothetical protein n=1 Tax=Mitsuokella sp. WILCCON 0060 TaxID=3345341 RepID=UPI003F1AFC8C
MPLEQDNRIVLNMLPEPQGYIPLNTIMERLQVSRNFVTRNIAPFVPFRKFSAPEGSIVCYKETLLRQWLKENATFTQLTKFATKDECDMVPAPVWDEMPMVDALHRTNLTPVPVEPMDFWDLPLIFPKNYHGSRRDPGKITPPEICYRDMFKAGAIKIQLGKQKTMFYIPFLNSNSPNDIQYYVDFSAWNEGRCLVPAMVFPAAESFMHRGRQKELLPRQSSSADTRSGKSSLPRGFKQAPLKDIERQCTITITCPEGIFSPMQLIDALQQGIPIPMKNGRPDYSLKTDRDHCMNITLPLVVPSKEDEEYEEEDNDYTEEDIENLLEHEDLYCPSDDETD